MWIESPHAQAWNSTTSCIVGNVDRTSKIFRKIGGTFSPENFSFPGHAHTLFPVVQVFPDRGKFFHSLHRIAR
jgi:hypothetical protein